MVHHCSSITSSKGRLFLGVVVLSLLVMSMNVAANSDGLVLWNKLGSQTEIENSEVGPDGFIYGSGISFVPGYFGNGFTSGSRKTGPNFGSWEAINPNYDQRGTVEFWWKAPKDYDLPWLGDTTDDVFVSGVWGSPFLTPFQLLYRWRGEVWNGGFDIIILHTPESPGIQNFRPGKVIPFRAGDWVHVAYVWDMNGLPEDPDVWHGIYVNGQSYPLTNVRNPSAGINFPIRKVAGAYFSMGYYDADFYNQLNGVLDNVKIYNYAKTDFSDRFDEAGAPSTVPSANLEIRAEPNPATSGEPFQILADLENTGAPFSGRFAVYLVANGSVKELKPGRSLREFPAGFKKNNIIVASTKRLPQYPPTVLFLVVLFDEATGAVVADDTVLVGVNGEPVLAELVVLESLAAAKVEQLRANALSAAPSRPSAGGKLTTTWGQLKTQR